VSVDEAAAALNVSPNTIRRWLKAGALRGERVERPQGVMWRVYLPSAAPPPAGERHVPDGTCQPEMGPPVAPPTAPASLEVARATALAEYGAALLAPVIAELELVRQENRGQAERLGHLTAELEAARAQLAEREAPVPAADAAPSRPWWTWFPWWRTPC
jgi:excisionase family DNA binding protein